MRATQADHGLGAGARSRARALLRQPAHARGHLPGADRRRDVEAAEEASHDERARRAASSLGGRSRLVALADPLRAARLLAQPGAAPVHVHVPADVPRDLRVALQGSRTSPGAAGSPTTTSSSRASSPTASSRRRSSTWRSARRSCATRACSSGCRARRCPAGPTSPAGSGRRSSSLRR